MNSSTNSDLGRCRLIPLQHIPDRRGQLTVIEHQVHGPFRIERVFFMQEIAPGESRGSHAHRKLEQFLICLVGQFSVELDDGTTIRTTTLNSPQTGLHIPPGIWAREYDFSKDAICLVLASDAYDEDDYIRDLEYFRKYVADGAL